MRILHNILILLCMLLGLSACNDDSMTQGNEGGSVLPNGEVVLKIDANIPAPREVVTRDIDPDGLGVQTLWLFCFDEFGSYIGRREATDFQTTEVEGHYSFTVEVPGATRIIHFLSNIYLDDISASPGMNETTLIPSIVSASGRMAYWGRKEFSNTNELQTFASGGNVELFRNQAQVCWSVEGEALSKNLKVWGYAICNRRAWGTVAPFDAGSENPFDFDLANPYVTVPGEEYNVLASDPTQVSVQGDESEGDPHYIFENPNTLDTPVYAIMKIGTEESNAKFYKIMFVNDSKDQLPIYRNYKYVIRITNLPDQMGYGSFDDAKTGIAANNAWVSIDPEIPELSDGTNTLNILNGTTQIFNEGGSQTIAFTYTGDAGEIAVSWLENDGSLSSILPTFKHISGNNYNIEMTLAQPGENPVIGTLLLRAGVFTRQIKIYLMKPFEFKPVWVSTGVPMVKGERMSMTFVIPENYPEELFPITCKIATNKMNANDDLGVQLPIVSETCEYQITNEAGATLTRRTDWGYKFVYTATRPGIQEVFFTLNVSAGSDPSGTVEGCTESADHAHVFLEADNFKDEEKLVLFQAGSSDRRITISGADANNPGFLSQKLYPTVNQAVAITLNFSSRPSDNTVMRMATTSLKPDPNYNESNYYVKEKTSNGVVDYYWIKPGNVPQLTLHFLTNTPDVDDLVRFSIDNENEFGFNEDANTWYKSAAVELVSDPKRFTFDFSIVDDTPNIDNVKYGIGQPADMHFSIPKEAVAYTDVTFFIRTNNLIPNPDDSYSEWLESVDGGYNFTIPKGFELAERGTLRFLTNRIASAETVTISTLDDKQALFTPASTSFENEAITGTLTLSGDNVPTLTTNSFITLERKNGTRVGVFNVQEVGANNIATYKLVLRPEYDFTMDETLTIYYSAGTTSSAYQATTTFNDLVDHEVGEQVPLITLNRN